ncbi:MAG: zinc finger domain-containing protein, partial [Peribacillus sp.]
SFEQLFIVSEFDIAGDVASAPSEAVKLEDMAILVTKAEGETCERCWNVSQDVGQVEEHPTLCPRCATVVKEHYTN